MPLDGTADEIGDNELLYRRFPASKEEWYNPEIRPNPFPEVFHPHKDDHDGLSISRAKSEDHPEFLDLVDAAKGRSPKGYFVAVLRAGDLKREGIRVVPDPIHSEPANLGHALLSDLNAGNRRLDEAVEMKRILADKLTLRVEGPFHVSAES